MDKQVKNLINKVKRCAKDVYNELGEGWSECVYQEAMEVALRGKGISYETQRILPISFKGHVVGQGKPDLVVWINQSQGKRLGVVIDLKWDTHFKEDHRKQIIKYIQELKKQVKRDEKVYDTGFVINFVKDKSKKIEESGTSEEDIVKERVKILEV